MSAAEIAHRSIAAVRERLEASGVCLAKPPMPLGESGKPWLSSIPDNFDTELYCTEADRILAGRFRIFALQNADCSFPPDWNRDPKSGVKAPLTFGKAINYRDQRLVGDIKYLWEPNRHLELVTLAQAWHLTQKAEYAIGCRTLLESWIDACPYPCGPNWSSSLELGIRLLNWTFAWHLLGSDKSPIFAGDSGQAFRARWLTSVYQHCHFIVGHRSFHSSANNHLLGELLGVLAAAATWPMWPEMKRWGNDARCQFETEMLKQNHEDGVNKEQGIWYHHEVADMMLLAILIGRPNGYEFSPEYWKRWEAMLEFITSVMDTAGNVPAIGDADDAVMVRLNPAADFHAYRSLVATGAVLCKRSDFKAKAMSFDAKSRWLLGDSAADLFASLPMQHREPRREFRAGGYYILGSDFDTQDEVRIVADAGPLGYLSIAAHGHADALSFTLSARGTSLLIDPGTYAYHTNKKWRDYFRGTSAHNTIRVDDQDQSVSGGNFLWLRHAAAHCQRFDTEPANCLVAYHDGYTRLSDPVVHRRSLTYTPSAKVLLIQDELQCLRSHRIEMFWHFDPACSVVLDSDQISASTANVVLKLNPPPGFELEIFSASEQPPLGWLSARFDDKVPCTTVRLTRQIAGRWEGTTTASIVSSVNC